MKKLGIKNFRRFAEYQELKFGNVNFFVGCNNSGKSSVVKAILLLFANLVNLQNSIKNKKMDSIKSEFDFAPLDYHRALHIGSFDRAANVSHQEDSIIFDVDFGGNFVFKIEIGCGKKRNLSTAPIKEIKIKDLHNNSNYVIDYETKTVHFDMSNKIEKEEELLSLEDMSRMLNFFMNDLKLSEKIKTFDTHEKSKDKSSERSVDEITQNMKERKEKIDIVKRNLISKNSNLVKDIPFNSLPVPFAFLPNTYKDTMNFSQNPSEKDNELYYIADKKTYFDGMKSELAEIPKIEYISAHAISQDTFYKINDRDDYMAQTIQDIFNLKLEEISEERKFIVRWMKAFKIGENYQINTIDGNEGYYVKIIDADGREMNMAEKGIGSIQLIILLFKIGYLIKKYNRGKKIAPHSKYDPIILLEEPEQNLHPSVQALLADLFYEINQKYHIRFIVETHSEYIIRRAQSIIAEEDFASDEEFEKMNPFKVFYFPSEGNVFDMEMTRTGKFGNSFDEGFFDVAAKLNLKVFAAERRKNNVL